MPTASVRQTLLVVAYVGAAVVAFAFLLLPIVAIFAHTSPARRAPGATILPDRPSAGPRRPERGPRALLRARPGRVRRHDHVRRQPAEGDADPPARDLRRVRPQLRRDARDERRARTLQRRS